MRRVVVTGVGAFSPIGHDWPTVFARLKSRTNAIAVIPELAQYEGLTTRLGAPAAPFVLDETKWNRKTMRSMGRVALLAVLATEKALAQAGLLGDPWIRSGQMGTSYGSCSGSNAALIEFGRFVFGKTLEGVKATTYIRMMPQTAPVNISVHFGLTGRIITTTSACTSGSQGIGAAYEAIKYGQQVAMVAGGSEEFDATQVAIFDTLFATSGSNDTPSLTPRPFDARRDGLVVGEGACTLVLESLEHAQARGAKVLAEVVGYGTNSDGTHVTQPNRSTMAQAMRLALEDAKLPKEAIGYVNAHGTATKQGDLAETGATFDVFGERMPLSSLKSYMGHTLGACGSLEAWMSIEMQRERWFCPTINLEEVDPQCAPLDYVMGEGRVIDTEYVMSNNFAFGGINTSLIFRRVP